MSNGMTEHRGSRILGALGPASFGREVNPCKIFFQYMGSMPHLVTECAYIGVAKISDPLQTYYVWGVLDPYKPSLPTDAINGC